MFVVAVFALGFHNKNVLHDDLPQRSGGCGNGLPVLYYCQLIYITLGEQSERAGIPITSYCFCFVQRIFSNGGGMK